MAYDFTAASSQYLSTASAPVTDVPLTICCWAKTASVAFQGLVSVGSDDVTNQWFYRINIGGASGTDLIAQVSNLTAVVANNAVATAAVSTNTWFHAAGIFASDASRTVYLNGGNSATNTNSVDVDATKITEVRFGRRHLITSNNTGFLNGQIADVGIWNAALTAAEIASLAKGMTCDKIRPQSLVFYAPLVRDLIDTKGGLTITNNNSATVANHPRVYS